MAFTSSSSTPPRTITFHVFLSFRGSDTRKNFVDHLYNQLDQKGIRTFRDDKGLEKGQRIEELLQIIKESQFAIVVFSKDYASAKWCLEEIATIIECQQQYGKGNVIPIFYDVEPSVVRNQTESFAESFKRHEEKENTEKLKRWKKALKDAGEISGYHLQNDFNGFHAACVKTVTNDIFTRVNQSIQASSTVLENFVGLETRVDCVGKLLTQEPDDVQFIGIWGMGGIGKTTIAMVVLKQFSSKFDGACFLKDVKEHKITELQETLLKTILKEKMEISDEFDGMVKIEQWLQGKKVLIVLDDVDKREQLKNLAGGREWFGKGSRVIITTRDVGVLRSHRVDNKCKYLYEVHALEHQKAIQLFSCYAFQSKIPATGFERLSGLIVHYCKGLPLALKVLGSSLCGVEAADEWENTFKELKGTPIDDIHEMLKISFDRLDSKNKEAFLYIACFFRYYKEEHVKDVLESCNLLPPLGLRLLIEKSLISVLESGKIGMHDLIQEMGWHIARQENPRRKVWESKEVDDVLSRKMDPKHIECIVFPFKCGFRWQNNENISSAFKALKILIGRRSYNEDLIVKDNYQLPSSLELIHFPDYPFSSLPAPTSFHPSGRDYNSLELRLCSLENCSITKGLNKLTYLNLSSSHYLSETPNFDMMPHLKKLYLSHCMKLVEIHPSVGYLKKLVLLDLSHCYNLRRLPRFIQVSSLQFLKLERCFRLEKFPEIQANMPRVLELNLESIQIRELPSSIGRLRGLTKLLLCDCEDLVLLCDELCELESLKILELIDCPKLESLPEKLGNLSKLEELHVIDTAIFELPSSITQLSSLECLCWTYNWESWDERGLKFVPSVSGLRSLKRLELSEFSTVHEGLPSDLEYLVSLEYLSLREIGFVDLPESFSRLPRLQYLDIKGCRQFKEPQETTRELEEHSDLPKLPGTTRELYADSCFASRRNITKLLAECPELHAVAFCDDDTYPCMGQSEYFLARMCIRFPLPRKTHFSVSYSNESPDVGALRFFQYRCYKSNGISIDLTNHSWYCDRFVGFAVYLISGGFDTWGPHSYKGIHNVEHCIVIAKLSRNNNRNEALQTKYVIVNADYTCRQICFAYIPFSSLCPESSTNTKSLTAKGFARFEVKFMNLKATANWGCSLVYQRRKRLASLEDSCSSTHRLPSRNDICPECTTDDMGPLHMLEYMNLSRLNFKSLPQFIRRLRLIQYLDISGCAGVRKLPELPPTLKELYAPYNRSLASESNIIELATKYSELHSVSFSEPMHYTDDYMAFLKPMEVAKKFIPITQPFLNRNIPFVITYPFYDYNISSCFKYPHYDLHKISISLDPTWYNHSFVGFVVCFQFPIKVRWESHPAILPFRHCELIAKLTTKDNGSEPAPLQTKCVIGRLYDEEFYDDHFEDGELVCFAYIPFSSLWPKSEVITDTTTPNHYSVFEAAFQDLEISKQFNAEDSEISTNWSCGLLYTDDESLIEELRQKRENGHSESDSENDDGGSQHTEDSGGDDAMIEDYYLEDEDKDEDGRLQHTEDSGGDDAMVEDNNPGTNKTKMWESTAIVDRDKCQMISMPECFNAKVARLLYTNSGVGILALSSNGIQRLWTWPKNEQNPTGKATANYIPQYWQPSSGLLMINDVLGVNFEEVVPCIDRSKNDSYIVSAAGRMISLFHTETFQVLIKFRSSLSTPTSVVFYPFDNSVIAIGMKNAIIYIYNVRLNKVYAKLIEGHNKHITGLAFSTTHPIMLVSSSADARLCVWNIVGRKQNRSVYLQSADGEVCSGDTHVMFHTDQLHLLVTHETQLAIYNACNMRRMRQWIPQGCLSAPISSATYSCNSQLAYASFIDGNIGIFDADNLTLRCRIAPSAYLSQALLDSEGVGVVYAVVIAAHPQEPNQLAIGLTDGSIKVIEPLESEGEWGISPLEIQNGKEGEDEGRDKSLDAGQGVEVGMSKHNDSEKSVIDAALSGEIHAFTQPSPITGKKIQSDLNYHIEEDYEITTSQHELGPNETKLWESTAIVDRDQCRMVSIPECSDAKVARLLYTNSGVSILALSLDGIQKLWKWPKNEQNPTRKATANSIPQHWQPNSGLLMINDVEGVNLEKVVPCMAVSKDDSYIVSACGGKVSLFNIMTFEVMETITSLPSASTFLAFDPHDDNIIAIGTEKSSIHIYDRIEKELNELGEHKKPITGLTFSTNLKLLVSSDADAQLCSWNTRLWKKKRSVCIQLPAGEVCSGDTHVMFHVDQLHLLVTHETQLAIYDASKMECINQWIPHGSFSAPISSATYSCNCQLIYASFKDGNIGVFDAHSLRPRCRIAPSAYYLSEAVLNRNEGMYAVVIAAHPQEPNQLALGLTDGSVKVIEPLESEGGWGISLLMGAAMAKHRTEMQSNEVRGIRVKRSGVETCIGSPPTKKRTHGLSFNVPFDGAGHGVEVAMSKYNDSVNEKGKEREDEQRKKVRLNNDKTPSSSKQNRKIRDQSDELSPTGTQPPIVGDDVLQQMWDNFNCLLASFPLDEEYIKLEIDQTIFHHTDTCSTFMLINDIKDMMKMDFIDASIIKLFILFLNRLCNQFQVTSIGFVCPVQISMNEVKQNVPDITDITPYLTHVMEQHKNKQFILAPYLQKSHWLLLVICISSKSIYVLDPLPHNRTIEIKNSLNRALHSVSTNERNINWKQCKCPIQPGGVECGYYVMRYMFDIVTKYSSFECLDEAFESNNQYSINEINEIRDLWAKYFLEECMGSRTQ